MGLIIEPEQRKNVPKYFRTFSDKENRWVHPILIISTKKDSIVISYKFLAWTGSGSQRDSIPKSFWNTKINPRKLTHYRALLMSVCEVRLTTLETPKSPIENSYHYIFSKNFFCYLGNGHLRQVGLLFFIKNSMMVFMFIVQWQKVFFVYV